MKFLYCLFLFSISLFANAEEKLHLLIPGGAGGGWDTTARGIGDALSQSGLVQRVSFENMSGGSGSRALSHLIETASRQSDTLMISSTPIVLNSLKGIFPQTYKDIKPVASVIADYGAFVVRRDSTYQNWSEIVADFNEEPRRIKVAGGSSRGSMDHLVAALAIAKSGGDPTELRYIPYNAGGQAMVGLLSRETQLLSTGLSEALALAEQGEVRILASTAPARLPGSASVPTLKEQGVDAVFTNWRGLFAAPGFSDGQYARYLDEIEAMYETDTWLRIQQNRGWQPLFLVGEAFEHFLADQEQELGLLMRQLGLLQGDP